MTDHTLTVAPIPNRRTLIASCACNQWSLITPNETIASSLHRCHLADNTPHPTQPPPPATSFPATKRSDSRHVINHPAVRWWNRERR